MIRAALIDLDGTLVDSNDARALAWLEALREENVGVGLARVRRLIGLNYDQIIPILCGARGDSDVGRRIVERHEHLFVRDHLTSIRAAPGARELLLRLRQQNVAVTVTTTGSENVARELLSRARLHDLVGTVVGLATISPGETAPARAPKADLLRRARARTGSALAETAIIGDTPYDLAAANEADLPAIGFLCGGWAADALQGALAIYRDPADLVQRFTFSIFDQERRSPDHVPFPLF